ncbi:MAG: hypothetical protein NTZ26_05105, partial [Candidatus Aminicenantes bacterium]|nr:hypothetical protein [Candidatus Aminicenantes bacterium]
MKTNRILNGVIAVAALAVLAPAHQTAQVPGAEGASYEAVIAPGTNYDKAEFKLWLPPAAKAVRAIVVLVPGSNGDGRPSADDPVWREFATRRGLALLGCRFTDKPHDQG